MEQVQTAVLKSSLQNLAGAQQHLFLLPRMLLPKDFELAPH